MSGYNRRFWVIRQMVYVGYFKESRANGKNIMYLKGEPQAEGIWTEDRRIKNIKVVNLTNNI